MHKVEQSTTQLIAGEHREDGFHSKGEHEIQGWRAAFLAQALEIALGLFGVEGDSIGGCREQWCCRNLLIEECQMIQPHDRVSIVLCIDLEERLSGRADFAEGQ